jgi:hypothetical protein
MTERGVNLARPAIRRKERAEVRIKDYAIYFTASAIRSRKRKWNLSLVNTISSTA